MHGFRFSFYFVADFHVFDIEVHDISDEDEQSNKDGLSLLFYHATPHLHNMANFSF